MSKHKFRRNFKLSVRLIHEGQRDARLQGEAELHYHNNMRNQIKVRWCELYKFMLISSRALFWLLPSCKRASNGGHLIFIILRLFIKVKESQLE